MSAIHGPSASSAFHPSPFDHTLTTAHPCFCTAACAAGLPQPRTRSTRVRSPSGPCSRPGRCQSTAACLLGRTSGRGEVRVEGGKGRERWRWSGWLKACDQVQLRVKVGMIMDDLIKTLIHKLGILQTRLYRSHKGQIMHHDLSTLLSTYSDVWSLWRVMLRCWTLQGSCQAYHQIHPNSPQASRGNICSATDL